MNQHLSPSRHVILCRPRLALILVAALVGAFLLDWPAARAAEKPPAEEPPVEEPPVEKPLVKKPPVKKYTLGVLIRFEGPIARMRQQYLFRKLDIAKASGADLVIIEIDSPGGRLRESLNIAHRLRDLDWARTVAYVPREALSGAAIAALGCDEIVMGAEAVLGDAGPIFLGEDFQFRHAPEKIRSDLARKVRDLARAKGRPPALAEAMVDMDLVVYRVKNRKTGRVAFMSDDEIQSDDEPEQWEKVKPVVESRKEHFLEVNGRRAVELELAQGMVADREELRNRFHLEGDLLILKPSGIDTAVYILNLSLVTGLLFVVGLVALYVEFSAPGIGVGGLIAGLCFVLFFWSRFLGGTAGWLEVVLFASGIAFLLVELFVLPGFGVAGLSGALLLLASLVLACQDFLIPRSERQWATFSGSLLVLFLSGTTFAVAAYFLSSYLGSIPLLRRLTLEPPGPDGDIQRDVQRDARELADQGASADFLAGYVPQVGDTGTAVSFLRPAGKARFGNQYVDVVADGEFLAQGTRVEVAEISGNRVVVREHQPRRG